MDQLVMPGTMTPEQMFRQGQQKALIEALRQGQSTMQAAPTQAGRVTSAGAIGDGMDTGAVGSTLGKGFNSMFGQPSGQLAAVPAAPADFDWGQMMAPYK